MELLIQSLSQIQKMVNRKQRSIGELYNLTGKLSKPKITPILQGSYRMQGPIDDSDHGIEINKETDSVDKILIEESNQHSFDSSDTIPVLKTRACDDQRHTSSDTSNLASPSSSHVSFSENAESKANMRTSDTWNSSLLDIGIKEKVDERILECHGDNISCVTGVKNSEGFGNVLQVDTSLGSCDREGDNHDPKGLNNIIRDPFWKKGPHDSDPFPSSNEGNTSPKREVPSSDSRSTGSVIYTADSKDLEENSSSRHGAGPSGCSTGRGETSLLEPVTTNGIEGKNSFALDSFDALPCSEDTKAGHIRSNSSAGTAMKVYPCLETEHSVDLPPVEAGKREPPLASQQTSDTDHSGSDILEDDVKVCDICGDAGREDLLAVCSRCSDGAEHTYCMQTMLDKVPEGDWLCEECKLKEDFETQKSYSSETTSTTPKLPSLNEKIQDSKDAFNSKALVSKLDTKVLCTDRNKDLKATLNLQLPVKRRAENLEVTSTTRKQVLEMATGLQGIVSPGKKPALARETSLKNMDTGKVKLTHSAPLSGGHYREIGKSLTTFGSNSSIMPTKLHTPLSGKLAMSSSLPGNSKSGSASPNGSSNFSSKYPIRSKVPDSPGSRPKSSAFQNLNSKPKVKQVWEDASQKQKLVRESSNSDVKKEGSVRMLSRSMSNSSFGFRLNSSEPKVKLQNLNLSRSEDSRGLKQTKETSHLMERKNSFKSGHSLTNSSLTATARISHPKADPKTVSHPKADLKATEFDGKLKSSTEPMLLAPVKGSGNTIASVGTIDMKKQLLSHSGDFENGTSSNPSTLMQDGLSPSFESTIRDGRSRQSFMPGGRGVRCFKCNGIGHIAQYCNSGLLVSAAMASAARSSREVTGKSKWKHAVEAAMAKKTRVGESNRLPDRSDELSVLNTDPSCEQVSKDQLSKSIGADIDINVTANSPNSTSSNMKKLPSLVGTKQYVFANPTRTSAIPEQNYLWQGGFEVQRSGRFPDCFDGIQAYLSTSASPKVLEVANKLPCKLQLEEVPRLSSWPKQFHGDYAKEDNIALYFFAKDLESYERNYKKLLESMLKNDSALKGDLDGTELLILPSNRLPEKAQRWNRLFFLWGVFRERKGSCLDRSTASLKKLSVESLDSLSPILESPIMTKSSQKISPYMHMDREVSKCDRPLRPTETAKSSVSMDLPLSTSPGSDFSNFHTKDYSLNKKSAFCKLDQSAADGTFSSEKTVPETHPSTSVPLVTNMSDTCSSSPILMSYTPMSSEVKSNKISLKEVYRDTDSRKDIELQTCVQPTNVLSSPRRCKPSSMILDTSNCGQGCLFSSLLEKQDTSSDSSKVVPIDLSFPVQEVDPSDSRTRFKDLEPEQKLETLKERERFKDNTSNFGWDRQSSEPTSKKEHCSWESRSIKKHPHSHSSETASEASGETSKDTSQAVTWKDKSDSLSADRDIDPKKLKRSQSELFTSSREQHLCDGDFVYDGTLTPENSRTTERYFFPVDLGCVRDSKPSSSSPWPAFLTNDESHPEPDAPNLELALGAEKKTSNKGILPLFVQFIDKDGTREKPPDPVATDDMNGDLSSSLSLSLAFPFTEKERVAKPVSRTEQLLPDRHHVNTSLLLYGGYTDT